MKKLQMHLGGHPVKTENFSHFMTGVQEALFNVGSGLSGGNAGFKLWGIDYSVLTATDVTWTAGAMYINGEVCFVPAGSATKLSGQVFKYERYTVALPIDPQGYANAMTHDVHLETYARIIASAVVGIGEVSISIPTLSEIISPDYVEDILSAGDFTAEDDLAAPVAFTTTVRTVSWRLANKTMEVDVNISGSVASSSDNLYIRIPDSKVSAGNFHGTVFINDKAYIIKAETGQNKLKVASGGTDSFTGAFDVEGHISLRVA